MRNIFLKRTIQKMKKTYWKCIKYNIYKCRGRVHSVNDKVCSTQKHLQAYIQHNRNKY
jgi:hypothetical protein